MDTFNIGDRAVILYAVQAYHEFIGRCCVITSQLHTREESKHLVVGIAIDGVNNPPLGGYSSGPQYLRKIYPEEGKISWEECVFKPEHIKRELAQVTSEFLSEDA